MSNFIAVLSSRLEMIFDPQFLAATLIEWLLNVIVAIAVFVIFYLLWLLVRLILRFSLRRKVDETTFSFIETIVKFFLFVVGLIMALDSAGIKTSALLTSLGIVGLTIGFAARDALSNLISGILIFIDRPFVLGDLVEIDGQYGRVDRITLRSTRVVTSDGRMLAVPNTEVINKTVASYTNFPNFRIDVGVTVGVNEDLDNVRRLLLSLVKDDPAFMAEPAPRTVVTALNDYNVAMELQAWIFDERRHVERRFELREKVFKILTQAGVELPFETIQLQPVEVKLKDRGGDQPTALRKKDVSTNDL
ncbi:MAG: mechanosensitive ion channel protein MscS [Deltaproteobacteria bacterium HGW-Deltaproteobacteria-3]|nr:MAG: mechanosensitive ion channel protein MscS [Deltaproteobacteria bacterium HGW-Deltaproteobacteria-3]